MFDRSGWSAARTGLTFSWPGPPCLVCGRRCPPRRFCCWPQQALSTRWFALQLALLDPKGRVVAKWTGRLCAMTLAGPSRARVCPRLGSPAAASCAHARHLAAARRLCVRPFVVALLVLRSPFCGSAPGGGLCVHLPSCGSVSTSRPCTALSCALDINASALAAAAFSASPAGSAPAMSLARAGAAPTTSSAPPRSCVSTLEDSGSLTSAFSAIAPGPR